jgi:hypothetical protein
MKKKKLSGYVMVGALSVGIIGGVGTSAFATTSLETDTVKQTVGSLDAATQEKVQTIKEELKAQLAKLGVTLPERGEKGERFANLDDETKAKAEAIIEKEKAGTITHEEAKAELQELGVTFPEHGGKGKKADIFANLDDETKTKVEAIIEKEKAGTITHEEAKAELQELGVTLPEHGEKGKKADIFANLDDETKTKVEAIIEKEKAGTITHEEAKAELQELGVTLPEHGGKGKKADIFANLDDETKAKAQELMDNAKAELEELGVKQPGMKNN